LGELRKTEVRELAHRAGLSVHDKPDSTGICFIGERPFQEFLSRHLASQPGPIETEDGRVVGDHQGLAFYTLGQRSGLRIGGRAGSAAAPWYVAAKDLKRNALIVVQDQNHPLLLSEAFDVIDMHWLDPDAASLPPIECMVKTRYRQSDLACTLQFDGVWRVALQEPARAVTPGQYAVFYRGARCLGGGVIAQRCAVRAAPVARQMAYNSFFSVEGS